MTILFWVTASLIVYGIAGYGVIVIALARCRVARPAVPPQQPLAVTLLIAAYNEAEHIGRKVDDALQLDVGPHRLEVVVVSDGSTDKTVSEIQRRAHPSVRLIDIPENKGKVSALNAALTEIGGDIVVFSDANSTVHPEALLRLLDHFGDPAVGGVCGRLAVPIRRQGWLAKAERIYWRYDNAIKEAESRLSSTVSAQGSLYAVRRDLINPLPLAMADDLMTSLRVVASGRRLVFEPRAITEETVSDHMSGEFRRRVRSTERGWRGLMTMRQLLNPMQYGIYALQLFSHKVLRRLNAYLVPLLFPINFLIAGQGQLYAIMALAQAAFYASAAAAYFWPAARRVPGTSLALFFVITHLAMAVGIWRVAIGRRSDRWIPVRESGVSLP
jgi:cellulose synthase/poly-beta-1,6-N-acetylglucosamine synthase-like glycosyltransferase